MNIVLLDEAQRRFEAEDEWWREHRDAKELFVEELTQTLEHLRSWPETGQRYRLARNKLIFPFERSGDLMTVTARVCGSHGYRELLLVIDTGAAATSIEP